MLFCDMQSSIVRRGSVLRHRQKANFRSPAFDVQLFLESTGLGRTIRKLRGKEVVFSQGDPAKDVMYIQEGGVKLTVVNETGKEAVVAILGPGDFLGKGASRASPNTW
jgi:CRP-like cAMP-binding protein